MNVFFFLIIFPNVLNQDSFNNFDLYEYYIQYNSANYIINLYQNNITESIIKQFPLKNKFLFKDDHLLSIELNSAFNIFENRFLTVKKGNIISDGNRIYLYYKNFEYILSNKSYTIIGNFKDIDKLIQIYDYGVNSVYINVISSCVSTIVSFEKKVIINPQSLSFLLFSRKTLPFFSIPYLYFHNNNYELSKYCSIENNGISILCTFGQEMYQKFIGTNFKIIEVIPGCEYPIDTGIIMEFSIENCELLNEDGSCNQCYSGYKYNKKKKKCEKKSKLIILVIILPFIWILSILLSIYIIRKNESEKEGLLIVLSIFFGPITLIGIIIYYYTMN